MQVFAEKREGIQKPVADGYQDLSNERNDKAKQIIFLLLSDSFPGSLALLRRDTSADGTHRQRYPGGVKR